MLKDDWRREIIWNWYHGLCILCHRPASSVHEIVPRSNIPTEWDTFENRVPLCSECHDKVQANPSAWAEKLQVQRDYMLQLYGIDYPSSDTASTSKDKGM